MCPVKASLESMLESLLQSKEFQTLQSLLSTCGNMTVAPLMPIDDPQHSVLIEIDVFLFELELLRLIKAARQLFGWDLLCRM